MKWRVERAGSPGHYFGGWVASNGDTGIVCDTWREALDYAEAEAEAEAEAAVQRVAMLAIDALVREYGRATDEAMEVCS